MFLALLALYAIIAVVIFFCGLALVCREPTAHGQSILLPFVFGVAIFWLLALAYALIIAGSAGIMWCLRRFGWAE